MDVGLVQYCTLFTDNGKLKIIKKPVFYTIPIYYLYYHLYYLLLFRLPLPSLSVCLHRLL